MTGIAVAMSAWSPAAVVAAAKELIHTSNVRIIWCSNGGVVTGPMVFGCALEKPLKA